MFENIDKKEKIIKEICKTLIEMECYELDMGNIREFLGYIQDTTVLGDILADLKS